MEKNDSYFSSYKKTSLADLLETPEIVNNQSSSFTKTLYAMKGFARDFAHLRIKSSYNYPEVSEALRRVYGEELTEKVIADFESLTLSLEMFMKVKPVMEKW